MNTLFTVLGAAVLLGAACPSFADEADALPQPFYAQVSGGTVDGKPAPPEQPEAGDGDTGAGTGMPAVPSTGSEMSGKTVPNDSAGGAVHDDPGTAGKSTAPAKPKSDR